MDLFIADLKAVAKVIGGTGVTKRRLITCPPLAHG